MHIVSECCEILLKTASTCLSDMQRRLNRLMNSQVALQGLPLPPPPLPPPTPITHISNTHTLAHTLKLSGSPDPGDPHDSLMSQASAHV